MLVTLALCPTDSPGLELGEHPELFSPERREQLARCLPQTRRESVAGRLLLSHLLRERCPDLPLPPRLDFGAWEKPRLRDLSGVYFNISHSEGWAVCALCEAEVGVDLQKNRNIYPGIAKSFAPAEQAMLERIPEPERACALCQLWTLKEAWCKCTGEGLSAPLDAAVFTLDPLGIDRPGYQVLCPPPPAPEWALSLCVRTRERVQVEQRVLKL
jgi:4'-phosphopantetheinyl transferase